MTSLQVALLCGGLIGLGLTLIISRLLPATIDSKWAIDQLDPAREPLAGEQSNQRVTGLQDRLGLAIERRAPASIWGRVPRKDLALVGRPVHVHFGEKALVAAIGLVLPACFAFMWSALGISVPITLPAAASLILAAVLWEAPDWKLRREAKKGRREFIRALATYIDLVALERASGTGAAQSMSTAAQVGDSSAFKQIKAAIDQAEWVGQQPWDVLRQLATDLAIPELADLAEIMRLSREQGSTVYEQLRARSTSLRNSLLSEDLAKASAASEQMSAPVAMLGMVFLMLLATPPLLRLLG